MSGSRPLETLDFVHALFRCHLRVQMLADAGVYVASGSSLSRVLRAHGQTRHRGRAKAPQRVRPPSTHVATAPRQVFCWDMTYLPATLIGRWFYL